MEMSFLVLENNEVCDKGGWATPICDRSCRGNWNDSSSLREKSHSTHSYQEFLKQTNYWAVCSQFPVLNYIDRNLLHLLCPNTSVLQWHSSPPPFSRRWWMTNHPIHVSSTTQSSSFHYCISNYAHELLVMLLHQCCPQGESAKQECSHGY